MASLINSIKSEDKFILFIYLYVFTTPFYFFHSQYPLYTVLLFLCTIYIYKNTIFFKIKNIFTNKGIVLLSLYFLYTYLTLLWTEDIEHGFAVQKIYREALFYIPIIFLFFNKKQVDIGIKLFTVSFGLYALYSIGFYFEFYSLSTSNKLNPQGHLGYETVTVMMTLGIFFSLVLYYFEKKIQYKVLYIIVFLLSIFALIINNGRAAQLSFILVVLTLIVIYRKNFYSVKILISFLISLIITISVFYNNTHRFEQGFSELNKVIVEKKFEGSWGIRAYMYITGLKIIKENPMFGVGAGDSKQSYRQIASAEHSPYAWYSHMHNQHIELLSRYGFVGYLLFLVSIGYLLYSIKNEKKFFIIGLIFYLTIFYNSFFNDILDRKPIYIIFFVIFAMLASLKKKKIL